MAYISVNLGPTDPQPGNYSLYIQSCESGSTQQLVTTGLTNPDSFPYYLETTDFSGTSGATCITYELIDEITSCSCSGNVNLFTPTPTISLTPTPTPSLTPLSGSSSDYITIGGYIFSSGSTTVFDVTASAKYPTVSESIISFDIILKDSGDTEYSATTSITISRGQQSTKQRIAFNTLNYDELNKSYIKIENAASTRSGDFINTHGNFIYGPSNGGPQGPQYITHRWVSCCDSNESIYARVPLEETQFGGWVYNGEVVSYNGSCWYSIGAVTNISAVLIFTAPDAQGCQSSVCQDLCDDNKIFNAVIKECCPPYNTHVVNMTANQYPPYNTEVSCYFNGEMYNGQPQIPLGCYRLINWQTVDGTPNNTHEISSYHSSCDECTYYNIAPDDPCTQTQYLWRAVNCCNPSDYLNVQVDSQVGSLINLSQNSGFIANNGNCYRFINSQQILSPSQLVTINNFIASDICNNTVCPNCVSLTPTPTPSPTPSSNTPTWTATTKVLELSGCCDNQTYNTNITLDIATYVGDFVHIVGIDSTISSGCYKVVSINNQSNISNGYVTQNYGDSSCSSCLSSHPCLQQYTGCSDNCSVVSYPYEVIEYSPGGGSTWYIPTIVTEPSHLSPLANESGVVTNEAWVVAMTWYIGEQYSCDLVPWLCDQVNDIDGFLSTADLLSLLSLYGSLESTINESITCPSVYTQGLSPILNDIYYVPQEDKCYEYVGNVNNNGQEIISFGIGTSYSSCTECIEVMLPSPSSTTTPTTTPSLTPTVTPSITPSITLTPTPTPSTSPTEFIYKVLLSGCCSNSTYLDTIQFTSQISQLTDTFFWSGNTTQNLIPQCYSITNFVSSTDTPSFTINNDTPYSSCTECVTSNPCNFLYKAVPCCSVGLDPIFVTVNDSNLPVLGLHGIVYDHNCYVFVEGQGTGTGVITVTSDDYLPYLCNDLQLFNQYCGSCASATPSQTPSNTTTPTVTPTLTPSATNTVTPTTTPSNTMTPTPSTTSYQSQSVTYQSCCDNVVYETVANVYFTGSITSLSEGDAFIYQGIALSVVDDSPTGSTTVNIYLNDSQIFTGETNNCTEAILNSTEPCLNIFYSGCSTGNIYLGLGNNSDIYYTVGDVLYGPSVFSHYGDYCVTVIDNSETYTNYQTVYINDTLSTVSSCCDVPSTTPTPTPSQTQTPTPTPSTTPFNCLVLIQQGSEIYTFNPQTQSTPTLVFDTELSYALDVAHTDNKMWVSWGSNKITEYDITLSPFSATFNREITTPFFIGSGLAVGDNNNLLYGTRYISSTQTKVVSLDITPNQSVTYTDLFSLVSGHGVAGDIIKLSDNGGYILSTGGSSGQYILQYNIYGDLIFEKSLDGTDASDVYGLYSYNGGVFLLTYSGELFEMDTESPYTVTSASTYSGMYFEGASQLFECATGTFEPNVDPDPDIIQCDNDWSSVLLNNRNVEVRPFVVDSCAGTVNVGVSTRHPNGDNSPWDPYETTVRYVIEDYDGNVLADSLYLGEPLTYTEWLNTINNYYTVNVIDKSTEPDSNYSQVVSVSEDSFPYYYDENGNITTYQYTSPLQFNLSPNIVSAGTCATPSFVPCSDSNGNTGTFAHCGSPTSFIPSRLRKLSFYSEEGQTQYKLISYRQPWSDLPNRGGYAVCCIDCE